MSDSQQLRYLLRQVLHYWKGITHKEIPEFLATIGLKDAANIDNLTKAQRFDAALEAVPDALLREVSQSALDGGIVHSSHVRNLLQDLIWPQTPEIPKRIRRQIAKALTLDDLIISVDRFDKLLKSLYVLDADAIPFLDFESPLQRDIDQHVYRNQDWTVEILFDKVGAIDSSHGRFRKFIEGIVSAETTPDTTRQHALADAISLHLAECGLELRETDNKDGYPVFDLIDNNSASSDRPKNLIFASPVKPDLRFRDAVSNNVEIVEHADKCLIYDRPISNDGISWNELQDWWREANAISDDTEAKRTLYTRLKSAIPKSSPPQLLFFNEYHSFFGSRIPRLPALLPEVWLHWDPKTVKQRGASALARSRMDFLMLLPRGLRVVIEVDGMHHYSRDGQADPNVYALMVAADRQLKLDGYQVFRFGALELGEQQGPSVVANFFTQLYARFGVS